MTGNSVVLVTGGAGYIGSHAALALRDAGVEIAVLDDLSTGRRFLVPEGVPFVQGNVGDAKLLADTIARYRIGSVMHFAASLVVSESVGKPLEYYRNNTANSLSLLEVCRDSGVNRIVFSSTAATYGIPEVQPVTEDTPTRPINPYGASKLMTEWMLRDAAAAHGLRYVALRYFNVAGADPAGRSGESPVLATHLVNIAARVVVGSLPSMKIFGEDYPTPDGTCIRDYIHVSDLASAHLAALRHLEAGGENLTLNCGYGHGYSVKEVLDTVERVSGAPLKIERGSRRPGDPPELVAAADRIRNLLRWTPQHDNLEEIVRSAIAWERQLPGRS